MRISDWSSDVCSSDLADRPAEGLGAAGEGLAVEALADRSVVAFSGKHVAALPGEALAVLEPAQILDGADRDVAVGADAPAPAGGEVGLGREEAVAGVGLRPRRSEEGRVGKAGVSTCSSRGAPCHTT